jgi:hypothetical protein
MFSTESRNPAANVRRENLGTLAWGLAAAMTLALGAPSAHAETTLCQVITSLPTTISSAGVYCLQGDLTTSIVHGAAVLINSNNVVLDCNGFKIGGLSAGPASKAVGIRTSQPRANIEIRGCSVRGYDVGIVLEGAGHVVRGNRIDESLSLGIKITNGDGSLIDDNVVAQSKLMAIYTSGSVDIVNNLVDGVGPDIDDLIALDGISVSNSTGGTIVGNRLRNVDGMAIRVSQSVSGVLISNNAIGGSGAQSRQTIQCGPGDGSAQADVVVGNMMATYNPPFGCTDGGGNVIIP